MLLHAMAKHGLVSTDVELFFHLPLVVPGLMTAETCLSGSHFISSVFLPVFPGQMCKMKASARKEGDGPYGYVLVIYRLQDLRHNDREDKRDREPKQSCTYMASFISSNVFSACSK